MRVEGLVEGGFFLVLNEVRVYRVSVCYGFLIWGFRFNVTFRLFGIWYLRSFLVLVGDYFKLGFWF